MTDTQKFFGILPAVVTPVDDTGRFQAAPFETLLARVYGAGVDGIYVCGQTGEGLQQTAAQRKQVAEVAMACSPLRSLGSGKGVDTWSFAHSAY